MEIYSAKSLYDVHGRSTEHLGQARPRRLRNLFPLLTRLALAIKSEMQARRDIAELASWDDRMLRDIGINRGEIENFVRYSTPSMARDRACK
jgi:uncharacterized protein YjiS (DUF1127 family)